MKAKPQRCDGCRFFRIERSAYMSSQTNNGTCRINAPSFEGWPRVPVDGWCGEFKPEKKT